MTAEEHQIVDVAEAGSDLSGEVIVLTLMGGEGERFAFRFPHELLARLQDALAAAGALAENDRAGRPQQPSEFGLPYIVRTLTRSGQTSQGELALEYQTIAGTVLRLALPRPVAAQTTDILSALLAQTPPRPSHQ